MWNRVDILTPAHNLRMLEAEWEDCFEFEASLGPQLQKKRCRNKKYEAHKKSTTKWENTLVYILQEKTKP